MHSYEAHTLPKLSQPRKGAEQIRPIAGLELFGGWTADTVWQTVKFNWIFKTLMEVVMTPVTYTVVNFLKRAESEDYYDRHTNFTPFSLRD